MTLFKYKYDYETQTLIKLSKESLDDINKNPLSSIEYLIDCLIFENEFDFQHRVYQIDLDINEYNELYYNAKLLFAEIVGEFSKVFETSGDLNELNNTYELIVSKTIDKMIDKKIIPKNLILKKLDIQLTAHLLCFCAKFATLNNHYLSALHLTQIAKTQSVFYKVYRGVSFQDILKNSRTPNQKNKDKYELSSINLAKKIWEHDTSNVLYPKEVAELIIHILKIENKSTETVKKWIRGETPPKVKLNNNVKRDKKKTEQAENLKNQIKEKYSLYYCKEK